MVKDDGRGIDVRKLKKKAVEKGLISAKQALMMDPASTRAEATGISIRRATFVLRHRPWKGAKRSANTRRSSTPSESSAVDADGRVSFNQMVERSSGITGGAWDWLWSILEMVAFRENDDGTSDHRCNHRLEKTADLIRCKTCGASGFMKNGLLKWNG